MPKENTLNIIMKSEAEEEQMDNEDSTASHNTILDDLQDKVECAYKACGFPFECATVVRSKNTEASDYQCNGAFKAAKIEKKAPIEIAQAVADELSRDTAFSKIEAVKPGFISMFLNNAYIAEKANALFGNTLNTSIFKTEAPISIILDFGGANVAKPLHVGHLRSAIIGESLKRIGNLLGHNITGDVHLGDWGLQMGMVITELKRRKPDLVYFDSDFEGEYPKESPVTIKDLETLYPEASKRAKSDEEVMKKARRATVELQNGRKGYRALWKHFLSVSIADLKKDYEALGVTFDLWLGESDAHDETVALIDTLLKKGIAKESEGALILEVAQESDKKKLPPLILRNSDGAVLYAGTDMATIKQRIATYHPNLILYVVDKRQNLHLEQVFRAIRSAGVVDKNTVLEHIGFGTMNGSDNKPFKTRAGGTMKLKDLILLIEESAMKRLLEIKLSSDFSEEERQDIARKVGRATLKFADLSNHYSNDYVFDVERFSSFEGRTGPYLLYSTVRGSAILEKAHDVGVVLGNILPPTEPAERKVLLELLAFPTALQKAWDERAPSIVCDQAYDLATTFSNFYHECPVLKGEHDEAVKGSRLRTVEAVRDTLLLLLQLLGIEVPKRM